MTALSYLQSDDLFYLNVFLKLFLGLLAIVLVINKSGKGNLAPTPAIDQVQNYVLGGIIGGIISSIAQPSRSSSLQPSSRSGPPSSSACDDSRRRTIASRDSSMALLLSSSSTGSLM